MLGRHNFAPKLYYQLSLDGLVPKGHLLRRTSPSSSISHRLLLRLLLGAAILQPYGATVGGPSGTVLQTFELVVYI